MMVKKLLITASLASAMLVTGCASTGSSAKTDADGYPVLEVLSNKPYVWDDSISEALNVARMAQPARVGQGMRDFVDGNQARVSGRSSTGERVAGGLLSGLGMGLYGVVSMEMLTGRVDRALDWRPAIVEIMPIEAGSDFRHIQQHIASKIIDTLKDQIDDFELKAVVTPKHEQALVNKSTVIVFDTEKCVDSLLFDSLDPESAPKRLELGLVDNFLEGPVNFNGVCSILFRLSFATEAIIDGLKQNVFVAEMVGDHATAANYFNQYFMKGYDGYIIVPEQYTFRANDGRPGATKVLHTGFARVHRSGETILFVKP